MMNFYPKKINLIAYLLCFIAWLLGVPPFVLANHHGAEEHLNFQDDEVEPATGHAIPGAAFQVYWAKVDAGAKDGSFNKAQTNEITQAVSDALGEMVAHRTRYPRFDEALTKEVLQKVIIEPKVFNRDDKEFLFLVARTKVQGKVKLLINASLLQEQGLIHAPDRLVPLLAREFQWVVSKADTSKKSQITAIKRNLEHAPILSNKRIDGLRGEEREAYLLGLFESYLTTTDEYKSLQNQGYYEIGSNSLLRSAQPDSTTKLYDIRVRQALRRIVRGGEFMENTPKAIRNLLNGKIWNVTFVHIDSRDWATRTRVLPKDKAIKIEAEGKMIQPAKILLNLHRQAAPEDLFYDLSKGLPMGALTTDQLAQVIALEIEHQIIEKSMRGHVASDEQSLPK